MKDAVKNHLLSLKHDIENWGGSFAVALSGPVLHYHGEYDYDSSSYPSSVIAIAQFTKQVAISSGEHETIKLAEEIISIAQQKDAQNESDWEDYNKALNEEYWESKGEYSPTDLGQRLGLSCSGVKMNKLISELGYQLRENDGWVATEKADGMCRQEYSKGPKSKPYIRWYNSFYETLCMELASNSNAQLRDR